MSARHRWSQGVARKPTDPVVECSRCDAPATMSEWSALSTGATAFYSYCSKCWHEPGPNAPSPADRTGVDAPDPDACTCATGAAYLCLRCERIAESQDIGF